MSIFNSTDKLLLAFKKKKKIPVIKIRDSSSLEVPFKLTACAGGTREFGLVMLMPSHHHLITSDIPVTSKMQQGGRGWVGKAVWIEEMPCYCARLRTIWLLVFTSSTLEYFKGERVDTQKNSFKPFYSHNYETRQFSRKARR